MVKGVLIGALGALIIGGAGLGTAPASSFSASNNWPMCGTFSLFSDDQCDAIEYCLNNDDPACNQLANQPSTPAPQGKMPQ
jgi:hypothetical protein